MRKKSHVSLAGYLVRGLGSEALTRHKKAFYFGSVLPDLKPKMFKEPHKFDITYEWFRGYVCQIVADGRNSAYKESVQWRRIGEALHYLADYFTYPHNTSYDGGVKGHCLHERDLKYALRKYVRTPEVTRSFDVQRRMAGTITELWQLFEYIENQHEEYLRQSPSVEEDCRWIVQVCSTAMLVMVRLACLEQDTAVVGPLWRCA